MAQPPTIKRKKAWRGKASMPPEETTGAVIYDAEGIPIVKEGTLLARKRRFEPSIQPLSPRTRPRSAAPQDIPAIVERYISLVGKVIQDMDARADKGLKAHEVNSVAAIGRAVAMLQAVESASITRVGGKAVKDYTSDQLRALLARSEAAEKEENAGEEGGAATQSPDAVDTTDLEAFLDKEDP